MVSKEHIATVNGKDLRISTKHAIEICNFIRGKNLLKSKEFLEAVIAKKKAVPFKRFNRNVGHRKGKIGSGRYPVDACEEIFRLLESLEINAQNKGLDTASLYLKEVIPNKASNVWHYGRQRRRRMKRTHVYILAEEAVKKKEEKKVEKKEEPKKEAKVEKKIEEKETNKTKGRKQKVKK